MKKLALLILPFLFAVLYAQALWADPLAGITIEPEQNPSTYDRGLYGAWIDADGDDEDTRQEVLIDESFDDLDMVPRGNKWKVASGFWICPYTGRYFTDPSDLDIDHTWYRLAKRIDQEAMPGVLRGGRCTITT